MKQNQSIEPIERRLACCKEAMSLLLTNLRRRNGGRKVDIFSITKEWQIEAHSARKCCVFVVVMLTNLIDIKRPLFFFFNLVIPMFGYSKDFIEMEQKELRFNAFVLEYRHPNIAELSTLKQCLILIFELLFNANCQRNGRDKMEKYVIEFAALKQGPVSCI